MRPFIRRATRQDTERVADVLREAARCVHARVSTFQKSQQFRAGNEKLPAKCATGSKLSALDETIDAEVIDPE
jgi:hypothetical protein